MISVRIEVGSEAYDELAVLIAKGRDVSVRIDDADHVSLKSGEGIWTPPLDVR